MMRWDVATRMRIVDKGLPVAEGLVRVFAFSPDGRNLAAAYCYQHHHYSETGAVVWDLAAHAHLQGPPTLERILDLQLGRKPRRQNDDIQDTDLGSRVGARVVLWGLASRSVIAEKSITPNEGSILNVAFGRRRKTSRCGDCPCGRAPRRRRGGRIGTSGRSIQTWLHMPEGEVNSVAFSPDSRAWPPGTACTSAV